ncbi:membrane fusion protein [Collimonas arenae]|uniref:Membrane fusion protein n=1 Tax=Collimonas arenae TaxID=279058 RepID=A0A127QIY8_9BURK|nr:efflux RND transporter periplasmic adaptor subunit [Collimonas arenae]AMP00088.1 membrane fusion protein [Collimonas arenae]AMP09984.1 membrane fusion protein [Collimonas arenae]
MQNTTQQPKKRVIVLAIGILAVVGIAWLASVGSKGIALASDANTGSTPNFVRKGDQLQVPSGSPLRKRLVIAPVTTMDAPHTLELPAQVEADPAQTINILPPVAGKVIELKVGLGDQVKKGQLLLVMSSGDFAQAAADRKKAADALQLTKKILDRQRGVQDAGAGAAKDLEQAESAYIQAQSEFSRADTRLKSLGSVSADGSGRRLNVVAPTSGSITALSTGVGQNANDPNAVLMTIANLDKVWITANVPENVLSSVKKGQAASIRLPAYPDIQFHGNVAFVSDVLQPDTRRALVRIGMPNADGKFKPNMFANALFAVAQTSLPVVPTSALLMNNDDTTVFVEVSPWNFVRRKVITGFEENGSIRVQTGLNTGDRVVTSGGVLLND